MLNNIFQHNSEFQPTFNNIIQAFFIKCTLNINFSKIYNIYNPSRIVWDLFLNILIQFLYNLILIYSVNKLIELYNSIMFLNITNRDVSFDKNFININQLTNVSVVVLSIIDSLSIYRYGIASVFIKRNVSLRLVQISLLQSRFYDDLFLVIESFFSIKK